MTGKQLYKIALEKGFTLDRVNGSHHIMIKGNLTVTIPIHANKDIPIGTANKILKQLNS
jgi:predicted RNA binding protein YcfA (HicA-like mRNA interferase family)